MIIGTAGHIDHGKTTLVRALTGVDTDRLPEEKRRGITIDLGFAPLVIEGVGTFGVVDVPGHEAFVRTMLAGATGIDIALVVVAADAGVMPQTREHLAILALLGVTRGVIALTKVDLVEPEWLALVEDDVRAALEGSPLEHVAIVPVSASAGQGLDDLRLALASAARDLPGRDTDDLFRMPVDRAFTIRGTGTVVTGTVWSGALARDASVRLFPSGALVRVRGLHAHGRVVDQVRAGERAAVALAGVDLDAVGRGAVLVQGHGWREARVMRGDVSMLPGAHAVLGARSRVRFHLGTSEVGARLVVREGPIAPGSTHAARIVLDEPLVARAGDRFVLRSASPAETLGGGVIRDPAAPARARPWSDGGSATARLALLVGEGGASGVDVRDLPVTLGVAPGGIDALVAGSDVRVVGHRLVGASAIDRLGALAQSALAEYHDAHPLDAGAPLQWLRSRLVAPDDVAVRVIEDLVARGRIAAEGGLARAPGFAPTLTAAQERIVGLAAAVVEAAGTEPPSLDELAQATGVALADLAPVARWMVRQGRLVPVEPERSYSPAAVAALHGAMSAGMVEDREYSPSELREMLGLSRKFLIPFLEYCDREGYTVRGGLGRRLATGPR